ncbi:aldolase [Aulographum hederae CBS 113979]|uniref:hydroxymethylglutaryl-CoA lyase n=1 Tax=Aulographum hederae CBS 113979 TaxID=1176131 RepID=A0A6G1H782_9PEZI|nr:aldolase [Aulographum hederae CBS 113979]
MFSRQACYRLARLAARYPPRRTLATAPSDHVNIIEVGPRDGLQNEKQTIPLETKIELVERLTETGVRTIEAGSFVSPKWTPQMANSSEILEHILQRPPPSAHPITYQFLAPNAKGLDNLLSVYNKSSSTQKRAPSNAPPTPPPSPGAEQTQSPQIDLSIFTAATETFTRKNTNCSIAESLERFQPIMASAKSQNIRIRAYISVVLGCPYEGPDVDPHKVAELAVSLLEMGADEISVADTTGMGTAPKTATLLKTLASAGVNSEDMALHFHDTYGMALVNSVVALEHGIRTFDSAVAGLGGCPYSPGATGNVATEDLVYLFESLGLRTGVDLGKMAEVGEWISEQLSRRTESRAGKAFLARARAKSKE